MVEDDLQWEMTFSGKRTLVEHALPFGRTRPSVVTISYQLSQLEIKFDIIEKFMLNCACTCVKKRQLNHYDIGVGRGEE